MLGQFLDILMSIGPRCPLNDTHISLQTPYCAHPFCEAHLWVYVMTFIILFWLIVAIGGHAGAILELLMSIGQHIILVAWAYRVTRWYYFCKSWCLCLFTDMIVALSTGVKCFCLIFTSYLISAFFSLTLLGVAFYCPFAYCSFAYCHSAYSQITLVYRPILSFSCPLSFGTHQHKG